MCGQRQQDAPCEADSAVGARRFVSGWLDEVFPEEKATDLVEDVELVTSELTANAVNAGCDILGLRLTVHDRWLEVALWDDAAGVPEIRGPRTDGIDGRGLLIGEKRDSALPCEEPARRMSCRHGAREPRRSSRCAYRVGAT